MNKILIKRNYFSSMHIVHMYYACRSCMRCMRRLSSTNSVSHAGRHVNPQSILLPVGTDAGPEDLLLQEQQLQKVLNFSDVYLLEVSGELLMDSSPRSLRLRAPFTHQDLEPLEALEALEEQPQPTDPPANSGGAVRCNICDMWCNCLKQYEGEKGHVQGKKHKRQERTALLPIG